MNKLDRMYKKAMKDMRSREKKDWFIQVSSKAVPAYFDMVGYCYNRGIECPDLNTAVGQTTVKNLLESPDFKEEYPKCEATFDILMKWWESPSEEDHEKRYDQKTIEDLDRMFGGDEYECQAENENNNRD